MGAQMEIMKDNAGNAQVLFLDKGGEKVDVGSSLADFQIMKELGKGHFGSVSLVKSLKTNKLYAMKKIELSRYAGEEENKQVVQEIKYMENMHHPHVITYFTSFREKDCIYIITEYINGGSLLDLIDEKKNMNVIIEENKVWDLLVQCLSGLLYLHDVKKIIHRDIKPDNMLLDADGHLKISDFGVSTNDYYHITLAGPIPFMAPEMAMGMGYNSKSDIYMLGLTFFYVASYQLYEKKVEYGKKIVPVPNEKAKMFDTYSIDLKRFIYKLLTKDPKQRPSSYEAYKEAFAIYAIKYLKTTCIASLIECLNCVKGLQHFILGPDVEKLTANDKEGSYVVTNALKNVLRTLNRGDLNYLQAELIKFRLVLLSGKERFNSLGEISVEAFIDFFLTKLHMELNASKINQVLENRSKIDFTNEKEVIKDAIQNYYKKYDSRVSDNFCYLSKTVHFCQKCNSIVKFSANLNLTVSFCPDRAALYVGKQNITVMDLFTHFLKKRLFVDENIMCSRCGTNVSNVNKVKTFYTTPNTFIMMLFYENPNAFKLHIDKRIDITNYVERKDVSPKRYYLVGAVFEKYGANNNNESYFSISRTYNGNWVRFNGNSFVNSLFDEINSNEPGKIPKVLFYSTYDIYKSIFKK